MDIIKELAELQDKFYKECGDLYEAIEVLGKPLYDEMLQNYFNTYKKLYKLLSDKFEIDIKNQEHVIKLEYSELTPHRCGFLWLRKNEARQLNERETAAANRMHFDSRWSDLDEIEKKIYAGDDEEPEKLSWFKRLFTRSKEKPADVLKQPEPPAAEEPKLGTTPATPANGSTPAPAAVTQPSESSTAAPGASDAAHQSDEKTKKTAEDVAKPPVAAPTSEEPKPKAKPKKVAQRTTEPPAPTAPAPQLSGQIGIDELSGNK